MRNRRSIRYLLLREVLVLASGLLVSATAALAFRGVAEGLHLLLTILAPLVFCLVRAGLVQYPPEGVSLVRRTGYQILVACALVVLLLFEYGVELLANGKGVPIEAGAVVLGFGMVYLVLIAVAEAVRVPREELQC
jgi:hypothetical protein